MARTVTCVLLLALAELASCKVQNPCDENQQLRKGYCWPVDAPVAPADAPSGMPATVDATEGEGGASVDSGAAPVSTADTAPAFGKRCASSAECTAPAAFCAIQPGQSNGFCSALGCDVNPAVCPAGWSCMDLAALGMAAHLCIPPT